MQEIEIEKIREGPNARKDFGDLDELAASIRIHGIIEPVVLDPKGVLFDGARRIRAAKMVGLKTAPYVVRDRKKEEDAFAVSMVANIHRADLAPLEEADAYKKALPKFGTEKQLAGAIGKSELYVKRRLALANLIPAARDALAKEKMKPGHAFILATFEPKKQAEQLRDLLRSMSWQSDYGVKEYANDVSEQCEEAWIPLDRAKFDASKPCGPGCPTCHGKPVENLQTTLLAEAGVDEAKKGAMLAGCFKRRQREWMEKHITELKKKGITVVDTLPKSAQEISSYQGDYKKIYAEHDKKSKIYTQPEVFALAVFMDESGDIEKKLVCLQPALRNEKGKVSKERAEAELERQRKTKGKEHLEVHLQEYWHSFLVAKTKAHALDKKHVNSGHVKALLLRELNDFTEGGSDEVEKAAKEMKLKGIGYSESFADFSRLKPEQMDRLLAVICVNWVNRMDSEELESVAKAFGFDIKKDFVMSEEYLDMHTTAQLQELAREFGLQTGNFKKGEMLTRSHWIQYIFENWKPGMVPKAMLNGKGLKEPVNC